MHVYLTEAHWKANGLTKRTAAEKLRIKKTLVSEALRAYAAAARGGLDKQAAQGKALKDLKALLEKCLANHRGNAPFTLHVKEMKKKWADEVKAFNARVTQIRVQDVVGHSELFKLALAFAKKEFAAENLEFLYSLGRTSRPQLIDTFIRPNAPQSVNISSLQRQAILAAPNNHQAWEDARDEVMKLVDSDTLRRFKDQMSIRL